MNTLHLTRFAQTDTLTLGILEVKDASGNVTYRCRALELPDNRNANNISRIPAGTYPVKKVKRSPAFDYPHLWVQNVPDRTGIKIHVANYAWQLEGCIAPGQQFVDLDNDHDLDVTDSGLTLDQLLDELPETSSITITDAPRPRAASLQDLEVHITTRDLEPVP